MVTRTASGRTSRVTARIVEDAAAGADRATGAGWTGADCVRTAGDAVSRSTPATAPTMLPELRINFLEVALVHQYFPCLASGARRDKAIHFHHVHEPGRTAEADTQAALEI